MPTLATEDPITVVQTAHYDPWGVNLADLESKTANLDWFQYSRKERDFLAYDEFEFRHYDRTIGRFSSLDPLHDAFTMLNGFNYADNSPIAYIDLYGLQKMLPYMPIDPSKPLQDVVVKGVANVAQNGLSALQTGLNFGIGLGMGAWNGAKGLYNFATDDAWKGQTWQNMGNLAVGMAIVGPNGAGIADAMSFDSDLAQIHLVQLMA